MKPISSIGSFFTIGRKTGMISSTMPTQSMKAPMKSRITIMLSSTSIVGISLPTMMFAM